VPVKATGAEINTGTNDAKFATPKAIADSDIAFLSDIPAVPVKATGAEITTGTNDANFVTPKAMADAGVNVPSGGGGVLNTGIYTGDDTTNRAIAHGLGVVPKYVQVFNLSYVDYESMYSADPTHWFGPNDNNIAVTTLDATNFYVGGSSVKVVNHNGQLYKWVAWG